VSQKVNYVECRYAECFYAECRGAKDADQSLIGIRLIGTTLLWRVVVGVTTTVNDLSGVYTMA
jgi:hypothetical protein